MSTHEGMDTAMVGIATWPEARDGKDFVGWDKTGIEGAVGSRAAAIVGDDRMGFMCTVVPLNGRSEGNRELIGRKKWWFRVDLYMGGRSPQACLEDGGK